MNTATDNTNRVINTEPIHFSEIKSNGHNAVIIGITFPEDMDWSELDDFLMNMEQLGFCDKPLTGVRRILDNVLGDEGRTDWLLEWDEGVNFNVLRRLQWPPLKWTEDFLDNYGKDYNSYCPTVKDEEDDEDCPEEDGDEKYTLVGMDGNAFAVMGYVTRAMRECKFSQAEIDEYRSKAQSGDYDNLLAVSIEYVERCNEVARGA